MTDRGEIKSLTGLRGVAACFVMAYHFFQAPPGPGVVSHVLGHGYLAVDMFFVLSGFVIAMIYGDRFAERPTFARYRDFLLRRIGRIYPLYVVITVLIIAIKSSSADPAAVPSASMIMSNLLLVQTWGFAESINGTTWSISTELGAYLLFPLIAMLILRGGAIRVAAAVATAAAVLVALSLTSTETLRQIYGGQPSRNGPLDIFGTGTIFPITRCLASFCLGVASLRIAGMLSRGAVFTSGTIGRIADLLTIAILVLFTVPGSDVAIVLLCVPFVLSLAASDNSITARVLSTRIIYWLGVISYSIYLVHRLVEEHLLFPLFDIVKHFGVPHAFSVARAVLIVIVLLISTLTYYAIEKPGRDGMRALMRGRRVALA